MIHNYHQFVKNVNEGLITTNPISKYKDNLHDEIYMLLNIDTDIITKDDETFKIDINQEISYDEIKKINILCNNLGYFITKVKIYRKDKSNIIPYDNETFENDVKNNTRLILYYESKFDQIIIAPNKLYHATNITHLQKILNIGLCPRTSSKLQYHPDRIYFSLNFEDCENLINKLRIFDKTKSNIKDYVILEINTNSTFRQDAQSNGLYTYDNIPIDNINLLYKLYMDDTDIIFDDIKFSKKDIKFYYLNKLIKTYHPNKK